MNIAFLDVTSTVSYGGIQTAIWELARALSDQGHRITIYGGRGNICPEVGGRDIAVHQFSFTPRDRFPNLGTRFRKLAERWSFSRQARNAVIDGNHDWVVLTKPFDFFWPKLLPSTSKTRFAFMSGGTDYMPGDRRLAGGIDAWLACSHFNAWQISSHYKRYPDVMFNGVDVELFHPRQRSDTLRTSLGVREHEVLFAFAGRLAGWKGLSVALNALAHPEMRAYPAKLLLVGKGDALADLQARAAQLGVEDRVIFHAAVPHHDLPQFYASADAGIFPSLADEAFGITIAEAMACGIPALASYNGGIPEVVGNEGSSGLLFPIGDIGACAAAMAKLCADAALRKQLGANARARIVATYTWQMAATRLIDTLRSA
ncbi:glycosyltransferase family 4 protein [Rhodocyclus gracilis]|uniref:Glycosyltransferase n=1 Tax=Rhodocyclus tenuis TaxID=1066 RepID=A0A6L5K0C4_RHOTE|nr:glycosyltransferase [Rhodocyclus gracilis]